MISSSTACRSWGESRKPTEFLAESTLVAANQLEKHVFLCREVEVERAPRDPRRLGDGIDVSRAGTGSLELHDGRVEHARARLTSLSLSPDDTVSHATIVHQKQRSLTFVIEIGDDIARQHER